LTGGDALATAHLAKLLHALARHQVLLAQQIFGLRRHWTPPPKSCTSDNYSPDACTYTTRYTRKLIRLLRAAPHIPILVLSVPKTGFDAQPPSARRSSEHASPLRRERVLAHGSRTYGA